MALFQNKYRVESTRMKNWDYSWPGLYFITICTGGREHYFGEITNNQMYLNPIGELAQTYWMEIPTHFPFILLDAFVVMPNHIHGIIIIEKTDVTRLNDITRTDDTTQTDDTTKTVDATRTDDATRLIVETRLIASLQPPPSIQIPPSIQPPRTEQPPHLGQSLHSEQPPPSEQPLRTEQQKQQGGFAGNKNPMLNDNLSRVLRWYKGRVSFESHKIHAGFEWQERFHDHIIRDEQSYRNIQQYIISNPEKWEEDRLNNKLNP